LSLLKNIRVTIHKVDFLCDFCVISKGMRKKFYFGHYQETCFFRAKVFSQVIVSDRDIALINTINNVFSTILNFLY